VYHKAVLDKKSSPGVLARLSKHAGVVYGEVAGMFNVPALATHFERSWVAHCQVGGRRGWGGGRGGDECVWGRRGPEPGLMSLGASCTLLPQVKCGSMPLPCPICYNPSPLPFTLTAHFADPPLPALACCLGGNRTPCPALRCR
jgi:hypothetical protein